MSTRDSPTLVRTTGISPTEGAETDEAELRRLRATVDTLEARVAETRTRLRERERELDAARERVQTRETELEEATEWAAFLAEELRERDARIADLEAERDRRSRRADQVVDRYEELLADARSTEESNDEGVVSRLRSLYRSVAPFSSM